MSEVERISKRAAISGHTIHGIAINHGRWLRVTDVARIALENAKLANQIEFPCNRRGCVTSSLQINTSHFTTVVLVIAPVIVYTWTTHQSYSGQIMCFVV